MLNARLLTLTVTLYSAQAYVNRTLQLGGRISIPHCERLVSKCRSGEKVPRPYFFGRFLSPSTKCQDRTPY
jgi:hypothetical protein